MKLKLKQVINDIETSQLKTNLPQISIGDSVKLGVLIQEGNKQRIQPYEGVVISKNKAGSNTTITVRKTFQGIGVERIFAIHSPTIQDILIIKKAKVRKAKLYYLRDRVGKGTRLKEKFDNIK